jgi:hypothetical protein
LTNSNRISRGPYCGAIGYLGFNRESQLNIAIRTAICAAGKIHFNVGAGIVADSNPAAEYEETLAKARGFFAALELERSRRPRLLIRLEAPANCTAPPNEGSSGEDGRIANFLLAEPLRFG